jgi:RimJ/RimL family protein N-acetyltransferase
MMAGHSGQPKPPLTWADASINGGGYLSGRRDLNPRPLDPQQRQATWLTSAIVYLCWPSRWWPLARDGLSRYRPQDRLPDFSRPANESDGAVGLDAVCIAADIQGQDVELAGLEVGALSPGQTPIVERRRAALVAIYADVAVSALLTVALAGEEEVPQRTVAGRFGRPRLEGEAGAVEHVDRVDAGRADIVGGERAAARSLNGRSDAPESRLHTDLLQIVPGAAIVLGIEPANDEWPSDEPSAQGQRDADDPGEQPPAALAHRSPVGRFAPLVGRHVAVDYASVPLLALRAYEQCRVLPGLEPATSSSRMTSGHGHDVGKMVYALVIALVLVGLGWRVAVSVARSSPEILHRPTCDDGGLVSPAGGFPVAQACPDRAAPTGSRWSALPDERPGPGRRGLMASGASPAARRPGFPERRGPGRAALAAGGQLRVLGPEALAAGGSALAVVGVRGWSTWPTWPGRAGQFVKVSASKHVDGGSGLFGTMTAVTAETSLAEKPTLTGDLVALRPVCAADAPSVFSAMLDSEVARLTGTHTKFSLGELEGWYGSRAGHDDRLDLAIVERATGECVGEVVLADLDTHNCSCSFRIALFGRRFFGRGFGTEASRMILGHAFDTVGLHRVDLEVYAFNPRARRVYEKVGFVYEGTKRAALCWDGEWIDAHTMAVLAPEWAAHRGHPDRTTDAAR